MIQIFCHNTSTRLEYILDFIFDGQFQIIDEKSELGAQKILNYSTEDIANAFQVIPSGLLEHESIIEDYHHGYKHDDVLSNIFYVVTRYEEYIQDKTDDFDRFSAAFSEQFKSNHLEEPIVDIWIYELKQNLGLATDSNYQFIPSFDIDNAWAYKNKGSMRTMAATAKDIVQNDKRRIKERDKVLKGKLKDPYDTYDQIEALKKYKPKVFFLLGDYSKYDRNINWKNKELQQLIRHMDTFADVGIHPSFDSFGNAPKVKAEKERLETILNREVTISRQHFLRLQLPDTYHILESIGIKEDYSMGYAKHFGWRAGTSKSFYYFDLLHNRKSELKVFPFQYMDGTLNEYLGYDIEKSKEAVRKLTEATKKYGGNFIPLWHNETIGNYGKWNGWDEVLNYNISLND